MRTKILKAVLYPLFFLLCLAFFVIQGFPVELIGDRLVGMAQTQTGMKVSYASLSTLFPNGVRAEGVKLLKEGKAGEEPLTVLVESVSARISLLGLIIGRKNVSFSSDLLDGRAEGKVSLSADATDLELKLSSVDLGKTSIWPGILGQELAGKATGSAEIHFVPKDFKASSGELSLDIEQGKIGNRKLYGMALPWIGLGKAQLALSIQKGKADIKTFKIASDDIDASMEGAVNLQSQLAMSTIAGKLQFKPSDKKFSEIRNQLDPPLRSMLDNALDRAKGKDGYYRYRVNGRIFGGTPSLIPERK